MYVCTHVSIKKVMYVCTHVSIKKVMYVCTHVSIPYMLQLIVFASIAFFFFSEKLNSNLNSILGVRGGAFD